LSIASNGDVHLCSGTIGNIYRDDILEIVDRYDPYDDPASRAVLFGGVPSLLRYAWSLRAQVDIGDCRCACAACRRAMAAAGGR